MRSVRGCTAASSAAMLMMYRGRWRSSRRGTAGYCPFTRRDRSMLVALPAILRAGGRGSWRDLDLARLDLLGLRDVQAQDAVLERRLRLVTLNANRELDRPAEAAVSALTVQVLIAVDLLVGLELAANRQRLAGHRDLDVVTLDTRQRRAHDDVVTGLMHVDRGIHRLAGDVSPAERADPRVLEEPVHRLSQRDHIVDWIESGDVRHGEFVPPHA